MSDTEMNENQASHHDCIDDMNSVYNPTQADKIGVIFISRADENVMFEVTSITLHLLQMDYLEG